MSVVPSPCCAALVGIPIVVGENVVGIDPKARIEGGKIQVVDIDYAVFLKKRGYIVDPDPELPDVHEAFKHHGITSFARHSRLGYTEVSSPAEGRA